MLTEIPSLEQYLYDKGFTLEDKGYYKMFKCPFHDDKTASARIMNGTWNCFGCSTGGDLAKFISMEEGISRAAALTKLGSPIEPEVLEEQTVQQEVLNHFLTKEQSRFIVNSEGTAYLESRKLDTEKVAHYFKLGCNKESIIIPITDFWGIPKGYITRYFNHIEGVPRYKSSPNTSIYNKGDYLFWDSRSIRDENKQNYSFIYLVEGYFDRIAMVSAGIENVAAIGTKQITRNQVDQLFQFLSPDTAIIVVPDKDKNNEGYKGAIKTLDLFREKNLPNPIRVVEYPVDQKDVADIYTNLGIEDLKRSLSLNVSAGVWQVKTILKLGSEWPQEVFFRKVKPITKYLSEKQDDIALRDIIFFLSDYFGEDPFTVKNMLTSRNISLKNIHNSNEFLIEANLDDILLRFKNKEETHIPTGLNKLDELILGLSQKEISIIAGRSSNCKTSLMVNMVYHWVRHLGKKVLIQNIDTSNEELFMRFLSRATTQSTKDFKLGKFNKPLAEKALRLLKDKISFVENTGFNLKILRDKILRGGYDFYCLDHFQTLTGEDIQAQSEMMTKMIELAKSANVHIVLLSQIRKETMFDKDKQVTLADLRGSSAIAERAQVVLYTEYFGAGIHNNLALTVLKNRDGKKDDSILLNFYPERMKIE